MDKKHLNRMDAEYRRTQASYFVSDKLLPVIIIALLVLFVVGFFCCEVPIVVLNALLAIINLFKESALFMPVLYYTV